MCAAAWALARGKLKRDTGQRLSAVGFLVCGQRSVGTARSWSECSSFGVASTQPPRRMGRHRTATWALGC
jgi:hypothetical protein